VAASDDDVPIEWVATGTLAGSPIELRGADRYTLRDGKVAEDVSPGYGMPGVTRPVS
jgi:hypothetical protein